MYDAAIIGGGPAGCAAAITLSRAGWRALLVERDPAPAFRIGESLPPGAQSLLRDLGVESTLGAPHLPCHANESLWGSDRPQRTEFLRDPRGLGWRLDRAHFDAALRAAAHDAGATILAGARARAAARAPIGPGHPPRWEIDLGAGGGVAAAWVVDASGRAAWLARSQGARATSADRLVSVFARMRPPRPSDDRDTTTLVEAAASGWWYTALLPCGERLVAFQTDADDPGLPAARRSEGWLARLGETRQVGPLIARWGYALPGPPQVAAASTTLRERVAGDGWVAVGDAAMTHDPLASQGILAALASGRRAAEALIAARRGVAGAIERYERQIAEIAAGTHRAQIGYYQIERRWRAQPFWRRRHVTRGADWAWGWR